MKTTQKFLMLTALIGFVAFIFGSLAAIGDVPDLQYFDYNKDYISISGTIAAIGAILILLSAFVWLVKSTIKIFKSKIEGKDKAWQFYLSIILLPIEMSLALVVALGILVNLEDVYKCYIYAYEGVYYSFLSTISSASPVLLLLIGLGEVILFAIVIFNKKLTGKKA